MGDTHSLLLAIITVCCGGTVLAANADAQLGTADPGAGGLAPLSGIRLAGPPAGAVTILRAADGLFYLDGLVAGRSVHFLVDTGANLTLLSPADAERAGVRAAGKKLPLETANGPGHIGGSIINRLELAGHGLENLRVGIGGDALPVSLLGQDALSRLGTITIEANELTIHPPQHPERAAPGLR